MTLSFDISGPPIGGFGFMEKLKPKKLKVKIFKLELSEPGEIPRHPDSQD
jgi:hypothetical protein